MTLGTAKVRAKPRCHCTQQSTVQLCLLAFAVVSLVIPYTSKAFAWSSATHGGCGKLVLPFDHQAVAQYPGAKQNVQLTGRKPGSSAQHTMKFACGVTAMLACALASMSGKQGSLKTSKLKSRIIVCKALLPDVSCTAGSRSSQVGTASQIPSPMSSANLLHVTTASECEKIRSHSTAAATLLDCSVPLPLNQCAFSGQTLCALQDLKCGFSAAARNVPRRMQRARRIGRARRSVASTRTARRATGTASHIRKTIGAKLKKTPQPHVMPLAFDPSSVRTRIQLGVRMSSCIWSEKGKEFKIPSGSNGLSNCSGVYILGSLFQATMEHNRILMNTQLHPQASHMLTCTECASEGISMLSVGFGKEVRSSRGC